MCMIKILHSGDWHLDSPMQMDTEEKTRLLRDALACIPEKVAAICKAEACDLMLLSGDLFDGTPGAATVAALQNILADVDIPVFITPGNHDFAAADSVWLSRSWPDNVHIFTKPVIESVTVPGLDCRVYGAGFTSMDCPGLLEGFTAEQTEAYAIGIFHGDPTQVSSPTAPSPPPRSKHPLWITWPWATSTRAIPSGQARPCAPGPAVPWGAAMTRRGKRAC